MTEERLRLLVSGASDYYQWKPIIEELATEVRCYRAENALLLQEKEEREAENARLQESVKQLEALLSVVSRQGSALMAVLTPEQVREALTDSREREPSAAADPHSTRGREQRES